MRCAERKGIKPLGALVVVLGALGLGACGAEGVTGGGVDGNGNGGGGTPTVSAVTVSGVQSVTEGETLQLRANASLSDGSSRDVSSQASWTSSEPGIATISATGLLTAVKTGTTDISAAYQGVTGRATVTVGVARYNVEVSLSSFIALESCDDFTQGLDHAEVSYQVSAILADGTREVLGGITGYPGSPSGSRISGVVQLRKGQVHDLTGRGRTYNLPGQSGQFVRVEVRATEWDEQIVIFPPSVRWVREDRMDDRAGSLSHSYSQGTWSSLGPRSITLGSGSCRMQLNYEVSAARG
jgi:hypothetical protein